MPVPTNISDLSTTAADNYPAGSEAVFPNLDNYLRAHAAFIAQLNDGKLSESDLAANTGAGLIGWIRAATGAVSYTLGTWLGWQKPNVLEFMSTAQRIDYLTYAGTLDVTTAVQAAETAATAAGRVLEWPGGCALITAQISRANGSMWVGEHRNKSLTDPLNNGTRIKFQPATPQYFWAPSGAAAPFRIGYLTKGFLIVGNSTNATGNSVGFVNAHGLNNSIFEEITITGFRYGGRCYATIDNRFESVKVANTYIASWLYDGGVCTTDVWEQYYFGNSPIGPYFTGSNIGIRFGVGIIESIEKWGVDLAKESETIEFSGAYIEDTPNGGSETDPVVLATFAAFRVGFHGTTLPGSPQLIIRGGTLRGKNGGLSDSLLSVDHTDGVMLGGFQAARYTNGIKTTANTPTDSIISLGWAGASMSVMVTDKSKVTGFWPRGTSGSSTHNQQISRLVGDQYTAPSAACTGAITTAAIWKLTKNGDTVTLTLPPITGVASATPSFTFGQSIPAEYRPSVSLAVTCSIQDNGASVDLPGLLAIDYLTGSISVSRTCSGATNFTAGAVAGLGQGCGTPISWTV